MTFFNSISTCLRRKYADFTGRASRSEYWWFLLFNLLASLVAVFIHDTVMLIVTVALLLPTTSAAVRRLHDVGRNGWWLLLNLVPLVGYLVLLYWAVQPSQPHDNEWGAPPPAETP